MNYKRNRAVRNLIEFFGSIDRLEVDRESKRVALHWTLAEVTVVFQNDSDGNLFGSSYGTGAHLITATGILKSAGL